MAKYKIEGIKELDGSIKRLGKVPQKCVTKAAKSGMNIVLRAARKNAPIDSGELRQGIVIKGERRKVPGKRVYEVVMDREKNDIFVKMSKDGKKRYYYPASQEYGFRTTGGGYVPGYNYLRDAMQDNARSVERKIVTVMAKEVDKELKKVIV